jgi:hypothetical protein
MTEELKTLQSLAEEACRKVMYKEDASTAKAKQHMVRWLDKHPDDYEMLLGQIVDTAIEVYIEEAFHRMRSPRWKPAPPPCAKGKIPTPVVPADVAGEILRRDGEALFMDSYKVGDKWLRSCTRKDLFSQAEHLERTAAGVYGPALFMRRVGEMLDGRKQVGRHIDDGKLKQMYDQADKDAKKKFGL